MILTVYLVQIQLIISNVEMAILCLTIRLVINKIKINYYLLNKYKIFKVKMNHIIIIH